MTEVVQFVSPTATLREVLAIFDEEEIRHLPVLSEQTLVGMISAGDVRGIRKVYENPSEPSVLDSPVSDYMNADVFSLQPEATIASVIDLMVHLRVGAAPVIDGENKALVGIVSYVDVLKAARERF